MINQEVRAIWNQNAAYWDEKMGEGNSFHRELVRPAAERLLTLQPDETVLEIACGNGQFARQMAEAGVQVVATDLSEALVEIARARTAERLDLAGRIEFRVVDGTDKAALLALGAGRFDAAVCTMALMDMAEIDPLLGALPRLLKPAGRFVFTIMHPCFNSMGTHLCMEEQDHGGELIVTPSVRVVRYLGVGATKGLAMIGQPAPQWYFHRPLHELLGACFAAGFVLDGLEEPAFASATPSDRVFGWSNFSEIPPMLAARLRLALRPGRIDGS